MDLRFPRIGRRLSQFLALSAILASAVLTTPPLFGQASQKQAFAAAPKAPWQRLLTGSSLSKSS
jgi:hypothetical protein